jgi:hypothetical protein
MAWAPSWSGAAAPLFIVMTLLRQKSSQHPTRSWRRGLCKPEVAEKTGTASTAHVAAGSDGDTYFSRVTTVQTMAGSLKSLLNLSSSAKTLSYDFVQKGTWSRKDTQSGQQTVWASIENNGQFLVNKTGRVAKVGDKELGPVFS